MAAFEASDQYIFAVSFGVDATEIVTASEDGAAVLWSRRGDRMTTPLGHDASMYDACVSPVIGRVVTAGRDGSVRLREPPKSAVTYAPIAERLQSVWLRGGDGWHGR
jgi:WD40 repeat protein